MRCYLFCKGLVLFLFQLFVVFCLASGKLVSERRILLEFKSSVVDSSGILSSWNFSNNPNHCSSWFGVSCNSRSQVISIDIPGGCCRGNLTLACSSSSKLSKFPFYGLGLRRRACSQRKLVGNLSPLIGKLTELRVLSLAFNDLGGEIPLEIWGLEKLVELDLEGNSFTGKLPDGFAGLRNLRVLNLGFNELEGEIPGSLSKFVDLEILNLAGNKLKGSIPDYFGSLHNLKGLHLANNQLNGSILASFGSKCRYLEHLDLSGNFLVGTIPGSLGSCRPLQTLLLFSNKLHGVIPNELGRLHKLEILDVSRNKLRGSVPGGLYRLKHLKHLSLAGNNLSGAIPSSFRRFRSLEDTEDSQSEVEVDSPSDNTHVNQSLDPIEIASIASASAIVSVLLVLVILFFYTRKWVPKSRVQISESKEITTFVDIGVPLTYEIIVQATGKFSAGKCIGNGGFGATYKAEIAPGTVVAVKRLAVGRFVQGVQQFHAEVKTLETMRHRNLVTLVGYHASETEMFLVYNYLPGGNLEDFIKERSTRAVDWNIIHKIALDTAHALAYLHDECNPKVLHRDVKPSNILLDDECNAYLSDFGLSRLLGTSETHATTGVAGTFGYVAPEYAMTCRVSEKADVYSYGVVLLELISDKKALDPSFSSHANGFNIVSWGCMLLRQGQAKDVFTTRLWETGPHDHLVELLHLAITCTVDSLSTRPTMRQVVRRLRRMQPSSLR